jgi:hypothetical protein
MPGEADAERVLALHCVDHAVANAVEVVLVAQAGDTLPFRAGVIRNVVRLGSDPSLVAAALLDSILDPGAFRAVVAPGILAPTGVSGWSGRQIVVSCDETGTVIAVDLDTGRTITLLVGVLEPHGVFVDRRKLLVAAKGSDEVLVGELIDGRFAPRPTIGGHVGRSLRLSAPHYATQNSGRVLIVDTDHNRILQARGDLLSTTSRFRPLDTGTASLCHPCGATFAAAGFIVVADTFNDRLLAISPEGGEATTILEIPAPVQVVAGPGSSGLIAAVSDDGFRIIQLNLQRRPKARVLCHHPAGGRNFLRAPFGVTIDRAGKVVIADRGRAALWVAELAELLAGTAANAA